MAEDVVTRQKKGFWARLGSGLTTLRVFVTNVIFLILMMFILGALFSSSGVVVVPDNSALVLNPRGVLVDQRAITDSLASLLSPDSGGREVELGALVSALERAAEDDRITMLVLRLDRLQGVSPGHADTLGKAVQAFRETGKETLAYGNFFSQGQYQLASYAESIYLHPMGQVVLPGYGGNGLYFKELLDKLNVNINIFRVGKYKEFVEPYTRSDMSAEAREANQVLIDALWSHYSDRIIANRDISLSEFNDYTQNLPGRARRRRGHGHRRRREPARR